MKAMNRILKTIAALTAAALVLAATGCTLISGDRYDRFAFRDPAIGLTTGEERTVSIDDFTFEPETSAPTRWSFELSSSDESVLSVSGTRVRARKSGVATLTASDGKGNRASCSVAVTDRLNAFRLAARNRSLPAGSNIPIDVYAIVNDGEVDAGAFDITWRVDGEQVAYRGGTFTIAAQDSPRTFALEAEVSVGGTVMTDEITVNYFLPFVSEPSIVTSDNTTFGLEYATAGGDAVCVWYVDGEEAGEGETFTPTGLSPGTHSVEAEVNGTRASGTAEVSVSGSVIPTGLTADPDSEYPAVRLTWDGCGNSRYEVSYASSSGRTGTVETDAPTATIEDLDVFGESYTFSVRSLGDGGALLPSASCAPVTLNKLPATAQPYLAREWYGGNYYISSDEEFFGIYDYFMLFREQPTAASTRRTENVYMGYETEYTTGRLSEIAFNRSGYTGSYEIDARRSGNVVTLTFVFHTVSTPDRGSSSATAYQLNGLRPHVSATERANYVPETDRREKGVRVTTTDQLYRVVEQGYRPLPAAGSPAETAYEYAKDALATIISDDMDEVERAHAIYDWIMWRVIYDDSAAAMTDVESAVRYNAFYLESVLTDDDYFAVCDGMSKAYSLMCNMEGLPCVRVTGQAGSDGEFGGHAWNKVMVNGEWFIVDCTWGDLRITLTSQSGFPFSRPTSAAYEAATHAYFLRTDAELAYGRYEDEDSDYPRTTAVPYNFYATHGFTYGGKFYPSYVTSASELDDYAAAFVAYARMNSGRTTFDAYGGSLYDRTTSYFAFEIEYAESGDASAIVSPTNNPLLTALRRSSLGYLIYPMDNMALVVTSSSVRL